MKTWYVKLVLSTVMLMSSVAALASETRCGVYSRAAHTTWLDDGKAGIDFLDSKLEPGVEFPSSGAFVCVSGTIGELNGRTQFITISAIFTPAPAPEQRVCGIYSRAAHTNWLDDGKDGIDFLDSKLASGVEFPKIGQCVCVRGVVGRLNGRTQFITVNAINRRPNYNCEN